MAIEAVQITSVARNQILFIDFIAALLLNRNDEETDKNSLCWRENIGEVALYVKGKMSTTYAVRLN
jgi:hypothetical protein